MTDDPRLRDAYQRLLPTLQRAREEAQAALVSILGGLGGGQLVRAYLADGRIKSFASVADKLERKKIGPNQLLDAVGDLIGFRIVCNNVEDVYRINDAVVAADRFDIVGIEDYIETAQLSGYRALHIDTRFAPTGSSEGLPCEIQMRTAAQDAWARLTHHDIFKQDAPPYLRNYALRLSSLLSVVDDMAFDLRGEARRPAASEQPSSLEDPPTPSSIAFIFNRAFGKPAPDYLARLADGWVKENGLHRLDTLDALLQCDGFRSEISAVFQASAGWSPSDDVVFEIGVVAATKGRIEAKRMAACESVGGTARD